MRDRRLHGAVAVGKINVTPLIDVVMCLIIFYLLVGRLAYDRSARVQLPRSMIGAESPKSEGLIINIAMEDDGTSRILVDGRGVELEGLAAMLGAVPAGGGVQIRADRRLPYGSISPVVDACRRAGLTSVRLTAARAGGG
jgi:biopolymer transport protein ExbD